MTLLSVIIESGYLYLAVPILASIIVIICGVSASVRKYLKTIGIDISRRWHAFISCTLANTYNEAVLEKKEEMFQTITQYLNSNDVRILEIGVGCGANLKFYPKDVNIQFVGLDPNQYCEKYLRKNIKSLKNIKLEHFSTSYAESMKDIPNNSIDCLISTIVLCSVRHPEKVLAEIKRVLKPGCSFFFMEHVAAKPGSYLNKAQIIFNRLWGLSFDGCNVIRETIPHIENAGFQEVKFERFNARLYYMLSILRPHIFGHATK